MINPTNFYVSLHYRLDSCIYLVRLSLVLVTKCLAILARILFKQKPSVARLYFHNYK
jgi:hypothetical protein